MTTQTDAPAAPPPLPSLMVSKDSLPRAVVLMVAPVGAYALVRPLVSSDALALAIAAAIPTVYSIVLALSRRRVDVVAALSATGFSLACVISVFTSGSSLPLKLHEALITFAVGLVLLAGLLIRRPLPIARLLRVHSPDKRIDSTLSAMIGGFLVHIDWSTVVLGILALAAYLRYTRAALTDSHET